MQDIVFYVVANETLGVVRDYANAKRKSAPVLALGVSVCLRMRLFAEPNNAAPYSIDSFNVVTDWQWSMDDDFDRNTACKLVADADSISVHTVTDTINGETMDFTEFVIPISNMNTEELATWIGSGKTRSGLTGELVGYDAAGHAVFVLQVENFTVRNRVAGLADPTAVDEGIVTRAIAEEMIQTAVSASAATKQDTLTSTNAGTGISISSAGVISVTNVPQSAVTGLSASFAGKQNTLTAGCRMVLVNGSTVDQARYFAIEPAVTASANQTTTVILSAGKAYEIHAVASNAKVLLNREEPVGGTRTFGLEGHIEIFVAGTSYVQTGSNVVLANALEPDSVNNCTVRFHDGLAIISVEDHIAGYIVISATGSTAGTLPYALGSASQEYVAFDAALNGSMLDMGGVATNGEKHIVGNGYADTILTGGVSCTSKTTFANLAMSGVVNSGGTMTLGDVYIPNGGTVSVSGGGLAVEKVTGNGGVIDLGRTNIGISSGGTAYASGCTVSGGSAMYGGAFFPQKTGYVNAVSCLIENNSVTSFGGACYIQENVSARFEGCTFVSNSSPRGGALAAYGSGPFCTVSNCTITGNSATSGGALFVGVSAFMDILGCTISGNTAGRGDLLYLNGGGVLFDGCELSGVIYENAGSIEFAGSNSFNCSFHNSSTKTTVVTISSGAIIDLTDNSNPTPINPGSGVTFEPGGATVYPSAGAASAYVLGGMTVPQIGNTNILNASNYFVVSKTATNFLVQNAVISNSTNRGAVVNGAGTFSSCVFSGNFHGTIAGLYCTSRTAIVHVVDTVISGNIAPSDLYAADSAVVYLDGCTVGKSFVNKGAIVFVGSNKLDNLELLGNSGSVIISGGASISLTSGIEPGGAGGITLYGGSLSNPTVIVYSSGGVSGSRAFEDLEIHGSTVTNLGLVYGATVYSFVGDDHEIVYTPDDGATSSSVVVSGETVYVVPGALMKVSNT